MESDPIISAPPIFSDPIGRHVAARLAARVGDSARVCAGFSGGLDSVVLLDTLARLRGETGITLSAVHVHHGLSPNADRWADFCAGFGAGRGIEVRIERVSLDRDSPLGIEGEARRARHAVFAAQPADVVALAHHLDDQAETVLLQMLRGTGLKGASAMPEWRSVPGTSIALLRPLLEYSRQALESAARARGLAWIEDESNAASDFDRNFLRNDVLHRLGARFPQWRDSLARFARHAASAEELLAELARHDGVEAGRALEVAGLAGLSPARQANALRAFLADRSLAMPSAARLEEMARQLFGARRDARVRLEHDGVALVRHRGAVHVDRGGPGTDADPPESAWIRPWRLEPELDLGAERGLVRFHPARGSGIEAARTSAQGWHFAARHGGERLRPEARRPTRTLKNLLRESALPEWERGRLPLLFHGERLVWVPGVGIDAAYQCAQGAPGLVPEWIFGPET